MAMHRITLNIFSKNHASILNPPFKLSSTLIRVTSRAFSKDKGFWSSIVAGDTRSGAHSKILANNTLYELQCNVFINVCL